MSLCVHDGNLGCCVLFAGSVAFEEQRRRSVGMGRSVGKRQDQNSGLFCCGTTMFAPGWCFQTKSFELGAVPAGLVQRVHL